MGVVLVVLAGVIGLTGILLLIIANRISRAPQYNYMRNMERTRDKMTAATGRLAPMTDDQRDFWIKCGLAIDTEKNEWVEQVGLSNEAVRSVIGGRRRSVDR